MGTMTLVSLGTRNMNGTVRQLPWGPRGHLELPVLEVERHAAEQRERPNGTFTL